MSVVIMVTGGRSYADEEHVHYVLTLLHEQQRIGEIIHGACGWDADDPATFLEEKLQGADRHADTWARKNRVRVTRVPAYWKTFGRRAGPLRNRALVAMAPDYCVAFPGGAGTLNARKEAGLAGIPVLEQRIVQAQMLVTE